MEGAEEESAEGKAQRVTPLALKMTLRVNHHSKTNKPKGETNEKYITSSNHGYRLRFDRHGTARECGDGRQHYLQLESGAATCLATNASGRVTISDLGPVQNLHVEMFHLPPKTEFATFLLQVPKSPFGLAWYQGDIVTNADGRGVGDFTGIFNKETFIQAPGVAPAPVVFPDNASSNPATRPVQIYHLGIWFADATEAGNAGCPNTATPFDGDHQAGIQVLNTSNFPDGHGPLLNLQ